MGHYGTIPVSDVDEKPVSLVMLMISGLVSHTYKICFNESR